MGLYWDYPSRYFSQTDRANSVPQFKPMRRTENLPMNYKGWFCLSTDEHDRTTYSVKPIRIGENLLAIYNAW